MTDVSMKDYVDQRFAGQDQRVAIALSAVETAYAHSRNRASLWIAILAIVVSMFNLIVLMMWHFK